MDIEPGKTVRVTLTRRPRSAAAQKTLARIFLHDPEIHKSRHHGPKPARSKRRGGRNWIHTKAGTVALVPNIGDSASLFTTVDMIRDLDSISAYIEVS